MASWDWKIEPKVEGLLQSIEGMNCGILVEDWDGILRYANRWILGVCGYEASELEGQPVSMLVPEELREPLDREQEKARGGDIRTRLSALRRKDGRAFPVAVSPQVFKDTPRGEPIVLSVIFDLGEVHAARPMGSDPGSLAAELASVATRLQSLSYSAALSGQATVPVDHPGLQELSQREKEILGLLMESWRVNGIAERLFISPSTVRNHLKAIYRKVGVSSQRELIEWVRSLSVAD